MDETPLDLQWKEALRLAEEAAAAYAGALEMGRLYTRAEIEALKARRDETETQLRALVAKFRLT